MAIVVSMVVPGGHAEQYEAVRGKAMTAGQLPEGCQLHVAGPVEQGWRVISVWESPEALERFRDESLLPAIREVAGDDAPAPQFEVAPVHKLITA